MNIIQYTWFIDSKERVWLIHSIWIGDPKTIDLLEYGKTEIISQPYQLIKDLINNGQFKPLSI